MNAPLNRLPPGRPATSPRMSGAGALDGVARHVAAEGCQFVLCTDAPAAGRWLVFVLESGASVTGRISWVVDRRIGFAFDRPLGPEAVAELSRQASALKSLRLIDAASAMAGH